MRNKTKEPKEIKEIAEEPVESIVDRVATFNDNIESSKAFELSTLSDRCKTMELNKADAYRVLQKRASQLRAAMAEVNKAEKAATEARAARDIYRTVVVHAG